MRGTIRTFLERFTRRDAPRAVTKGAAPRLDESPDTRTTARVLADAIDRAMSLGLWDHADRIARTASRLAPRSPRLTEPLARLRLAEGRPETALSIIAACQQQTASLRLLRAACLVQTGRKAEAHSDLMSWSRKSIAPLDARLMLGLLEWEMGDDHAATLALLRNLRHLEDPRTLELLVLIAVQQGRPQQIALWSRRLRECSAFGAGSSYLKLLFCSLLLESRSDRERQPTADQVGLLAAEITAAEQVIPALVEAQRRSPQRDVAMLLAQSIEYAYGDLTNQVAASESLARLALILDDAEAAARWADRAQALSPDAVSLTILAREMAGTRPDPAREVIATIGAPAATPAREKAA
jgi:hypothetical protein